MRRRRTRRAVRSRSEGDIQPIGDTIGVRDLVGQTHQIVCDGKRDLWEIDFRPTNKRIIRAELIATTVRFSATEELDKGHLRPVGSESDTACLPATFDVGFRNGLWCALEFGVRPCPNAPYRGALRMRFN